MTYEEKKLIELEGEVDKSTVIIEDFNTPLSVFDRKCRHKSCKGIVEQHHQSTGFQK